MGNPAMEAMGNAIDSGTWQNSNLTLCKEVGHPIDLTAIVFEDNQPVIDLTKTLSGKVT
jgi:hypothetical protein